MVFGSSSHSCSNRPRLSALTASTRVATAPSAACRWESSATLAPDNEAFSCGNNFLAGTQPCFGGALIFRYKERLRRADRCCDAEACHLGDRAHQGHAGAVIGHVEAPDAARSRKRSGSSTSPIPSSRGGSPHEGAMTQDQLILKARCGQWSAWP